MKKTILLIILTLPFVCISGQNKSDTLKNIEEKIQIINNDSSYWTSTFSNEAFLDSGFINQVNKGYGKLTGYFKNGKICKIRELIGIKLLKETAVTDYYFSEGQLIFVSEQDIQGNDIFSDSAFTVNDRITEPSFEALYYFYQGKLIETVEKGKRKTMLLPNEEYFDSQTKEGQLQLSAKKYYALFSIKYKN